MGLFLNTMDHTLSVYHNGIMLGDNIGGTYSI